MLSKTKKINEGKRKEERNRERKENKESKERYKDRKQRMKILIRKKNTEIKGKRIKKKI